ncbi:ABC-type Na+ efflux pump, permease component [Lachnospiraceae bacterium NE2001]|nr:ABC-type Na+ efflux pump, permease component [Lachnospiraceae bacterium NE2001]
MGTYVQWGRTPLHIRKDNEMNKRENIYSLQGFGKVFRFTVSQTFKNKGYLASFVIFVLVMTLMGPIQYLGQHAGQSAAEDSIVFDPSSVEMDKLYVYNEIGTEISIEDLSDLYMTDDQAKEAEDGLGITSDDIELYHAHDAELHDEDMIMDSLGKKDAAVFINVDDTGYTVSGIISKDSEVAVEDIDSITETVKDVFEKKRLENSNVSSEDVQMIFSGVSTSSVVEESDYVAEANRTVSQMNYMFYMLGFAMIIFIVISMSNSYIITSVTEEKQSKLVESLLVSVRPMALLMGKICGMMSYVVMLLVCGVIGSNISNAVMKNVFSISESEFNNKGFNFSIFKDFGVFGAVCLLLSIVLGFLAFGTVSGLFGSTCNKTEDIQDATGNVMMITMFSYFIAIGIGAADMDILNVIASLVPPLSFFTAPVAYVTGRIGIAVLIVSYIIQILLIIGIMMLSAKSYRNLLLSDSTTPKLRTIFKSAKG